MLGDILPGISVQVQKVIQGLEENDESQGDTPNLKLEPGTLELSPKTELQESMHFSDVSLFFYAFYVSHFVCTCTCLFSVSFFVGLFLKQITNFKISTFLYGFSVFYFCRTIPQ